MSATFWVVFPFSCILNTHHILLPKHLWPANIEFWVHIPFILSGISIDLGATLYLKEITSKLWKTVLNYSVYCVRRQMYMRPLTCMPQWTAPRLLSLCNKVTTIYFKGLFHTLLYIQKSGPMSSLNTYSIPCISKKVLATWNINSPGQPLLHSRVIYGGNIFSFLVISKNKIWPIFWCHNYMIEIPD